MKIKLERKILLASVLLNIIYYSFVFYTWQNVVKPLATLAKPIPQRTILLATTLFSAIIIFLIFQSVDFVYKKYKGIPLSRHFMYSFVLNLLTVVATISLFIILFI